MIRVAIANTHSARVYDFNQALTAFNLVKEFVSSEVPMRGSDLLSDRPGQFKSGELHRAIVHPEDIPKEVHAETFAKELAKELELSRSKNEYDNLVLVMQPHMMGLVNKYLNSQVKKLIRYEINKDYMALSDHELPTVFKTDIKQVKSSRP